LKKQKNQLSMNNKHHIQELENAIEHIKKEPIKGWIGKISKALKIKKIERKIQSLKKR
jgi:hypothetical protein